MLLILLQCSLSFVVVCCASVIYNNQRYQPHRNPNFQQYPDYYYQEFPLRNENFGNIIPPNEVLFTTEEILGPDHYRLPASFNEAEEKYSEHNKFRLKHQKKKFKKHFKKRRRNCRRPYRFRRFRNPNRNDVTYDNTDNVKIIPVSDNFNFQPQYLTARVFPSRGYIPGDDGDLYANSIRRQWNVNENKGGRENFVNLAKKPPDSYISFTEKPKIGSYLPLKRPKRKNSHTTDLQKLYSENRTQNFSRVGPKGIVKLSNNTRSNLYPKLDQELKFSSIGSDSRRNIPVNKAAVEHSNKNLTDSENVVTFTSKPQRFSISDGPLNISSTKNITSSSSERSLFQLLKASKGYVNINKNPAIVKEEVIIGHRPQTYSKHLIKNKIFSNEDDFYPIIGYRVKKESSLSTASASSREPPKENESNSKENFVIVTPVATLDVRPSSQKTDEKDTEAQEDTAASLFYKGYINNKQLQPRRLKSMQFGNNDNILDDLPIPSNYVSNILTEGWKPMLFNKEEDRIVKSKEEFDTETEEKQLDREVILGETEVNKHSPMKFNLEDANYAQNIVHPMEEMKTDEPSAFLRNIQPRVRKKIWINKDSNDLSAVVSSHIVVQ